MNGTPSTDSPAERTPEPRLLGVEVAAGVIGITKRELYRRIAAGDIESVTLGRRRLIPTVSIDAFVDRLRAEAAARRGAA